MTTRLIKSKNGRHTHKLPLGQSTDHAAALVQSGYACHQANQTGQAETYYTQALALDPANARALYLRGTLFFQTRRADAAVADLSAATRHAPGNPAGFFAFGTVLKELGRLDEAVIQLREAIRLKPDYPDALNNLGLALRGQGQRDEAIALYTQALHLRPGDPNVLNNLGLALQEQNKPDEAIARYRAALQIQPAHTEALNNLGTALQAQGKWDEAIEYYGRAVALSPSHYHAINNLGLCLLATGRLEEAATQFRKAYALNPAAGSAANNLGNALIELGKPAEALVWYQTAVANDPGYADAFNNLGSTLVELGRIDEAADAYEKAIELEPRRGLFYRMLADTGRLTPERPSFQRLQTLAGSLTLLPEADQMELHFALGTLHGNDPAKAFHHIATANTLRRWHIVYDERHMVSLMARIRETFSAGFFAGQSGHGLPSQLPIFVVGMPRSGTTLIEQILASHPAVFGAGELREMEWLEASLTPAGGTALFPDSVAAVPTEALRTLTASYLERMQAYAPSAAHVVDKMPHNFLRAGLIHWALPQAKIIHIRRDPVDTCLSCFSKSFTGSLPYTYDLGELGRFYRAYEGMMAHWRAVLPPGVMLEVRYEDVVAGLETEARRILAHCGLPWDDHCLAFHQTDRPVRTASAVQVRQPLYGSAVGRWHVFRDLARPLLDALAADIPAE